MKKSIEEWKKNLPPDVFQILWDDGTEPPFTGKYVDENRKGIYHCAGCENRLFDSEDKFHSGSGWPSFTKPIGAKAIKEQLDLSLGMKRTEVRCALCGGHLGHGRRLTRNGAACQTERGIIHGRACIGSGQAQSSRSTRTTMRFILCAARRSGQRRTDAPAARQIRPQTGPVCNVT